MAEYIDRNKIFPNKTFFASAENPLKSLDELIKRIWSIPAADVVEIGNCEGCRWRNRHQKCSCCRRNRCLKDCYEEG